MADFWYRCSLKVVPRLALWLMRLWFATCTLKSTGQETFHAAGANDRAIALFWHYSFFYNFYFLRRYTAAIMVSSSRDGAYIARFAELLGHVPVRGSSHQHGVRALRKIIELMRQGKNAAIVADGSQGPARRLQPGCILMASKSGKLILPMAWAAKRFLRIRSWDQTLLPLPFTTIVLHCGPAFAVPPDLSAAEIEDYRVRLETALNKLYEEAWQELSLPAHDGQAFYPEGTVSVDAVSGDIGSKD